ncbi:DNA-binding protein [Agrobacterium rhizogenes]|nr:DNA-binding protein [Rhizobium rhizogenes]
MNQKDIPPLDRWRLDALLAPPKILNTAQAIASRIGVSPDFVRNVLINEPDSPVKKIGGRYFAVESELINFFKPSPNKQN